MVAIELCPVATEHLFPYTQVSPISGRPLDFSLNHFVSFELRSDSCGLRIPQWFPLSFLSLVWILP